MSPGAATAVEDDGLTMGEPLDALLQVVQSLRFRGGPVIFGAGDPFG